MNMPSQPLLSICIPTYNRPKELNEGLRILEAEIATLDADVQERIEVIVSDNHTPGDPATAIVQAYPRVRFIRQERNVGSTLNFETCCLQATGRHLLLLSDDDHLVAGSLATICECLERDAPDVLFLPFNPGPDEGAGVTRHERNEFVRKMGFLPTLVSACIFKRALIAPAFGSYLQTWLHHFFYYLTAMENGEAFYSVDRQVLFCPYEGNTGGYNWFATFGEQLPLILREFPRKRIEQRSLNAVAARLLRAFIIPTFANRKINGFIINKKFANDSTWSIVKIVSRNFATQPAYWLLFVPLMLIPAPILRALKRLYLWQKPFLFRWHAS